MGRQPQTYDFNDLSGGVDYKSTPQKVADTDSSYSSNCDYTIDGCAASRLGSSFLSTVGLIPTPIAGNPEGLKTFIYQNADASITTQFTAAGTAIYDSFTTPTASVTGLDPSFPVPDFAMVSNQFDDYAIYGNGINTNLKYNGTWTNLSIVAPVVAPTLANSGAGTLPAGDYTYYVVFGRQTGGDIEQVSDNGPESTITIPINREITLSNIEVSTDPQVTCRIIYRKSPTSIGVYYRLTVINDNTTTSYVDNTAADGNIAEEITNTILPLTKIFEYYEDRFTSVDASDPKILRFSPNGKPWSYLATLSWVCDAEITCLVEFYNCLVIGTKNGAWVLKGSRSSDGSTILNSPKKFSSTIGIFNNDCAVGDKILYILGTDFKIYPIYPTDFDNELLRLRDPLSTKVDSILGQISLANKNKCRMAFYPAGDRTFVYVALPINSSSNSWVLTYNETQSLSRQEPVWAPWPYMNCATLATHVINNLPTLVTVDSYGFIWKRNDPTMYGDGAEENGIVTSATLNTLTDTTATWTPNIFRGTPFTMLTGGAKNQQNYVLSNSGDTIVLRDNWNVIPQAGDEYTGGGYDSTHFTNWKSITGNYNSIKQGFDFFCNLNAMGEYTVDIILQMQSERDQEEIIIPISLSSAGATWGNSIWAQFVWGGIQVFNQRERFFARFQRIRLGISSKKAGHPFQCNAVSFTVQDLGYLSGFS